MTSFSSFAEFVEHAKVAMQAFDGQMREEPKLSAADRRSYYVMVAEVALGWLDRAGDLATLTSLRDRISDALNGNQQLKENEDGKRRSLQH